MISSGQESRQTSDSGRRVLNLQKKKNNTIEELYFFWKSFKQLGS